MSEACACMGPCPECGVCKCRCQCPRPLLRTEEVMVYRKSDVTPAAIIPQPVAFFWTESEGRAWIGTQPTNIRYDLEIMPVAVYEGVIPDTD